MFPDDASVRAFWKEKGPAGADFEDFAARLKSHHRDDLAELADLQQSLSSLGGDQQITAKKIIAIKETALEFHIKMEIIGSKHTRSFDELLGPLIRKKLKEATCLCFKVGPNHKLEAFFRLNRDGWTSVEGNRLLPCSYHMLAISKWDTALRELEDLVNSPGTVEHDLQKFFEVYPELLAGKDYDTIIPQAVIVPDVGSYSWKADFVLSPFDQFTFATILELKLPSVRTTTGKRPAHYSFTSRVWHAMQQVRDYADAFDSPNVRTRFRETYHVDIFKPDLHLVIGKRWEVAQVDVIKKMKKDAQVRIETWDELLDRLKRQFS